MRNSREYQFRLDRVFEKYPEIFKSGGNKAKNKIYDDKNKNILMSIVLGNQTNLARKSFKRGMYQPLFPSQKYTMSIDRESFSNNTKSKYVVYSSAIRLYGRSRMNLIANISESMLQDAIKKEKEYKNN